MEYGYVRVSTKEQNEQRQMIVLREFGIDEKRIYMDKQSGKNFERANYKKLLRKVKSGDTLVVKSIDRLVLAPGGNDHFEPGGKRHFLVK